MLAVAVLGAVGGIKDRAAGAVERQIQIIDQAAGCSDTARVVGPNQVGAQGHAVGDYLEGVGVNPVSVQSSLLVHILKTTRCGGRDAGLNIHPPPALDVVWSGRCYFLTSADTILTRVDVKSSIDQRGLHQRGGGCQPLGTGVPLTDQRRATGHQRRGHAGSTVEHVVSVNRAPAGAGGQRRASRGNVGPRRNDVWLVASIQRGAAPTESGHTAGVIGNVVAVDRV